MDQATKASEARITFRKVGANRVQVTVTLADGTPFTDTVKLGSADDRASFRDRLAERFPGLAASDLDLELEKIAAVTTEEPASGCRSSAPDDNAATILVSLIESDPGVELFHTPGGQDSLAYVTVTVNGRRQTWAIRSLAFRQWLSRRFYLTEQSVPSGQALADAVNTLVGKAIHEGAEHDVHLRVAEQEGVIWLDLSDPEWRAVRITPEGWDIVDRDIPVRFVRRHGMRALPVPIRGGRIEDLRRLVNLPDDRHWILAIAWLVASFRPGRPFPLLNVTGEQGCAKSTLCKMLRELIDPAKPRLRRPPKDDRDLMIAASNSWVVGYDNISSISNGLSDSLCSLATGGGFATRELYTDDGEKIFDATRPVIVNGIEDAVSRPDLLDRSVNLHLPVIPKERRRDEDDLWAEFDRLRPGILGALLTVVSAGLKNIANTRLPAKPRMADFALWVSAAEPSLPWQPGRFLAAYLENRDEANSLAIEGSAIGPALLAMMTTTGVWEGTATQLQPLLDRQVDEQTRGRKDWPRTPKGLAGQLRRIAPNLRAMGIDVSISPPTGHEKRRIIRLEQSVATSGTGGAPKAHADRSGGRADRLPEEWSAETGPVASPWGFADRATVADRCPGSQHLSGNGEHRP